jgi:hypothetical protein
VKNGGALPIGSECLCAVHQGLFRAFSGETPIAGSLRSGLKSILGRAAPTVRQHQRPLEPYGGLPSLFKRGEPFHLGEEVCRCSLAPHGTIDFFSEFSLWGFSP